MPRRNNPLLAQIEARAEAKYRALFDASMTMLLQMGQDAAMIAANDVLHLGPTRAAAFCAAYIEAVNDMARLIDTDLRDDQEYSYAKAKIDARLREIVGPDNFAPWEVRYGRM